MEDTDLNWRKATYSNGGENCIEVADQANRVHVRDTQDRTGPVLTLTPAAWQAFTGSLKAS
jgi:Domain of unknown function (DUF397)